MGSLKTYLIALTCWLCLFATSTAAFDTFPRSPSQRATAFATCAGVYAAVAEHRSLFHGAATGEAADRRDVFSLLLDTVVPDAVAYGVASVDITAQRVQSRAMVRALLSAAEFNMMPERAGPARQAANAHIQACDRLLLS